MTATDPLWNASDLQVLFDTLQDGVAVQDFEGRPIYLNRAADAIFGRTGLSIEMIDLDPGVIREDETAFPVHERPAQVVLKTGLGVRDVVMGFPSAASGPTWLRVSASILARDSGTTPLVLTVLSDISALIRSHHALEQTLSDFHSLVESMPGPVARFDLEGRFVYANRHFAQAVGRTVDQIIGTLGDDFFGTTDDETVRSVERVISGGAAMDMETRVQIGSDPPRFYDNHTRPVRDLNGKIIGVVTISADITEKKRLAEQLERERERFHQTSKMEALGRLAGGIAHDFNNLLGAITGFGSYLYEDLPDGSDQKAFAHRILRACEHAKMNVAQILTFARAERTVRHDCDLRGIARGAAALLRGTLPPSVRIDLNMGDSSVPVHANESELNQLLLNLGINAHDALGGRDGTISIAVTRIEPGADDYTAVNPEPAQTGAGGSRFAAGRLDPLHSYARISVSDTGSGIDPAIMPRIFEPFFTTKDIGSGTGLGLAAVHGTVMSYDGAYLVSNPDSGGSLFQIYLPLTTASLPDAGNASAPVGPLTGAERILVVDDDPDGADVLAIGLERLGYEVVALNDPGEALEVFLEDPAAWDFVVTDQLMPGLKGVDLIARMREVRPNLPAVICTGLIDAPDARLAREYGLDCLSKPVDLIRLARHIRTTFDPAEQR